MFVCSVVDTDTERAIPEDGYQHFLILWILQTPLIRCKEGLGLIGMASDLDIASSSYIQWVVM